MAALRQQEQTAAAKHVGVTDLVWLGVPDGRVVADLDLRMAISRVIRQVRPQLVITQSPERVLERIIGSHPDHLATGEATLCAVYPDARNPFAFPELLADEGLEPWSVQEVWVMAFAGAAGARVVEITPNVERKIAALLSPREPARRPGGDGRAGPPVDGGQRQDGRPGGGLAGRSLPGHHRSERGDRGGHLGAMPGS